MSIRLRLAIAAAAAVFTSAPAQAEWFEASSKHFVVYAEGDADDARELGERLEKFDAAVRKVRSMPDPPMGNANRLTVFQVRGQSAIEKLAGRSNVAGFYKGQASGSYAYVPRRVGSGAQYDITADAVLFHEYTHHLMYGFGAGAVPAWFSEGFAEFFSTASIEKNGGVGIGRPAYHRGWGLVAGKPLGLADMLSGRTQNLRGEALDALYGRGWLLTHYLVFEPKRKGQLSAYLAAIAAGKPAGDAAVQAFGDLRELDRELTRYLGRRLSYVALAPSTIPTPTVSVRQLTPAETAIIPVRLRSKRGVNREEARKLVLEARKVAAAHPDSGLVQVSLAEAEFDAGEYARAEAAADRALALDPKHAEALIYKGMVRMRLAQDKPADPAEWKRIRGLFTQANKLDPEDAEPLMLFYRTYVEQGIKPTKNAVDGLIYALALAPQDGELRVNVARQHLIDGRAPEARRTLGPVAYNPHGGAFAAYFAGVIARLDEAGPAAALAMMNSAPSEDKAEADGN